MGYDPAIPVESLNTPTPSFRVSKFLSTLQKYWWIPVITLILCIGAGIGVFFMIPPTYVSKAALWETEKFRLPEGTGFTEDVQTALGTHVQLIKSSRMSQLAFARLKSQGTNSIPHDKEGRPLQVKVTADVVEKASVIVVGVESSDPDYSRNYLNALVEEFLTYRKNVRKSVSGETLSSISDLVTKLERDLRVNQEAFNDFQKTNNLAVLQEESSTMGSYLTKLKLQISDLKLESDLIDASIADLEAAKRSNSITTVSASSGNEVSSGQLTAIRDIQVLKLEQDRLKKKLRPQHPKMIKLANDIERAQKTIDVLRNQNLDQLTIAKQSLQKKISSVQTAIKEWDVKVTEATARVAEAERLKTGVSQAQTLYNRFAGLLQNVDASRNIDQETLSVLENASSSERIFKKEKNLAIGTLLLGLALGGGIILLITLRDDKISTSTEVLQQLNTAIVGQLPEISKSKEEKTLALIAPNDQRHVYAESYRNLRSALLFQVMDGKRPQVILITSSIPNEGKSTVAANLATTMALGGSKVLLIDADLRKGKLHTLLQTQAEPGFAELLSKKVVVDHVIQATNLPNLSFIGRGLQGVNPSDLFLSDATPELMDLLRKKFDHIIIDTCPVFAADDATTLAPLADGTLFVVRGKQTQAGMAREALDLLQQRQVKILGVVFNGADASSRNTHYYQYPQYYNS